MAGNQPECTSDEEEEEDENHHHRERPTPPLMAGPFTGIRLVDAPILLLLYFHKAMRAEFAELRRIAVEASEGGSHDRELVLVLRRRFEFLKVFEKYHSTAEDEVIFVALDIHVKNVVCTYSLEHKSIDNLFDQIFECLDLLLKEDEDTSKPFQELVFCIGAIQTAICQHMLKEEKQVFPLLMQQFSSKEQASLVWQFMSSVPIMLLEGFLPWMTSFISPDERVDFMHCLKEVVPKEKLLQEVVISWLDNKNQTPSGSYIEYGKRAHFLDGLANFVDTLHLCTSESHSEEEHHVKKEHSVNTTSRCNAIDGIHRWHSAILKNLKEILEELYQMRSSNNFLALASDIVQLNFFADVLIFYSNAVNKIFYPLRNEFARDQPSLSYDQLLDVSEIKGLQMLLCCKGQSALPLRNFAENLCGELELFVSWISKQMTFLEIEVFPCIGMNCSYEMQLWLLYTSLQMMPLGLLKCMITWFSAHLSEDESKSILYCVKQGGPMASKSLASLLCEWVRIGYSGKTSVEKFRKDLREMFNTRCSFPFEQIKEDSGHSYVQSDMQPCNESNSRPLEVTKVQNHMSSSLCVGSNNTKKYGPVYSGGINFHVFLSQTSKTPSSLPAANSGASSVFNLESRPMDHILFVHKALKKDLEYLVLVSAKLAENAGFLMDFHQRFRLVRFLYQIHSDSEDEIAFPALETKGHLCNISQSYTIDHKLEVEHFNNISLILDEISELHASVYSDCGDALGQKGIKYRQLCMKLHDMCISMHKILCNHIHHEEIELWPLFGEYFSIEEQEKIIGCMLGRIRAEILQEMIPWLLASLTPNEQQAMMSLWRKTCRNTMFDEWLGEWWEGMKKSDVPKVEKEHVVPPWWTADPLEVVSTYLSNHTFDNLGESLCDRGAEPIQHDNDYKSNPSVTLSVNDNEEVFNQNQNDQTSESTMLFSDVDKKKCNRKDFSDQADKLNSLEQVGKKFRHQDQRLIMNQEEMEAAIRKVSRDSTLDPQNKSYIIQKLLMSRWIATQQKLHPEDTLSKEEVPGQSPSYRDLTKLTYGCKHYKRNCKLVAACCKKLFTCRLCHDDVADHSMDRKATTKMMCMKCLVIQPIGPTCSTLSCHNLSMARYYCRICKLFDDEREIYHCPYCNLCRVGKGLGIDYFHCMNCNACMSRSLSVHICREKCFEDFCPICHEFIFTSSSPVKALPCGHLMHSTCFQDYTCNHYTCPICSKSLGDMQVYFGMLDALLAEEKIPDEYAGQTQVILCNDCEKRGTASFHWLHHKCQYCGSFNTRLL